MDLDECLSNPCKNGATCRDSLDTLTINYKSFQCTCKAGYSDGWCKNSYKHIKEYATEVLIENPPKGLRPGMTAKVCVLVELIPSALQVPLHAVLRVKGASYCLVFDESGNLQARAVRLGSANDASTVVESGLSEGEQVVVNASEFRDSVTFSANSSAEQGVARVTSGTDLIAH